MKYQKSKIMLSNKTQHQKRLETVFFFYRFFLMHYSVKTTKSYLKQKDFDDFQLKIIQHILDNSSNIHKRIDKNLSDKWSFSEISNLEKSILFVAIAEIETNQTPISVAISEAVKISQKFCFEKNYAYIHKVLDQILGKKQI